MYVQFIWFKIKLKFKKLKLKRIYGLDIEMFKKFFENLFEYVFINKSNN